MTVLSPIDMPAPGLRKFWFWLCLLPGLGTLWFILHFGVDTPFWDQWANAGILLEAQQHHLQFSYLFAQHSEAREVFPRLGDILLTRFGHWNQYVEMLTSLFFATVTAVFLIIIALRTCGRNWATLLAVLLGSLLIFSWLQWEAWLWGYCYELFIPACFLYGGWVISQQKWPYALRIFLCGLLALVAQYSFSNGLFLWLVLAPVLLGSIPGSVRRKPFLVAAACWIAAAIASNLLYFHNFFHTQYSPTLWSLWHYRVGEIKYFLAILANPIQGFRPPEVQTEITGLVLLLLAIAGSIGVVLRRDRFLFWRAMPWFSILALALISAASAAVYRVQLGLGEALTPRYAVNECHFTIGAIFLVLMACQSWMRPRFSYWRIARRIALGAITLALGTIFFLGNKDSLSQVVWFRESFVRAKAELQLCKLLPDRDAGEVYLWDVGVRNPYFLQTVYALDQYGYFRPHLLTEEKFSQLIYEAREPGLKGPVHGSLNYAQRLPDGDIELSGWAWNPRTKMTADVVVLTYRRNDGSEYPLAMVINYSRGSPDVTSRYGPNAALAGWERRVHSTDPATKGPLTISAWVYDPFHCQLWPLQGILTVSASSAH